MGETREPDSGKGGDIYKTIFENLPFVAFTLDRKGRVLEANRYTAHLFGMSIEDVRGKVFSGVASLGKKDLIKAFIEFRKNLAGKVTEKTVYKAKLKGGREILLELVGIPLKEGGKVAKVLDVGSDITERKDSEDELKRKAEELEKINKLAIGRELRMVELKKRIKELEGKLVK
jgi:PAS domain S-box-containing protein